jgi:CheY-like chemotaxis protein
MVVESLKSSGYQVFEAKDGLEALNMVKDAEESEAPFSLVVTDVAMPNMNGVELAEILSHDYPHIGIIVMTAVGDKDLVIRLLRSGVCEYIDKPFDVEEIISIVERLIGEDVRPGVVGELNRIKDEVNSLVNAEVEKQSEELVSWIRGGMKHRFNQPLTILMGNISYLKRRLNMDECSDDLKTSSEQVLDEMKEAVLCLRNLIAMFSSLKKIETSDYVGDVKIIDLEKSSEQGKSDKK